MSTLFTKIINGEIPGRFVWKDDDVVAFLTIGPLADGHTLVVPRQEVDRWTDAPADLLQKLMAVAQTVGKAQVEAFGAARAGLIIAGFEVDHLHVHVWPSNSVADFDFERASRPEPRSGSAWTRTRGSSAQSRRSGSGGLHGQLRSASRAVPLSWAVDLGLLTWATGITSPKTDLERSASARRGPCSGPPGSASRIPNTPCRVPAAKRLTRSSSIIQRTCVQSGTVQVARSQGRPGVVVLVLEPLDDGHLLRVPGHVPGQFLQPLLDCRQIARQLAQLGVSGAATKPGYTSCSSWLLMSLSALIRARLVVALSCFLDPPGAGQDLLHDGGHGEHGVDQLRADLLVQGIEAGLGPTAVRPGTACPSRPGRSQRSATRPSRAGSG